MYTEEEIQSDIKHGSPKMAMVKIMFNIWKEIQSITNMYNTKKKI